MKIAGVVVLYNPDENVEKNIESYIGFLDILYAVDNSLEPNKNRERFQNKKIKYISNKGNKGIAHALNVGAKMARNDGYDWLLTMDQDSCFRKNGLKEMTSFLDKINEDKYVQKILESNVKKIGLISPLHITEMNKNTPELGIASALTVMTSGNLINLKIHKKIGGFNNDLFIDCVDFDYCLKLKEKGYNIIQLNYIKMDHQLGDTKVVKKFGKKFNVDNHNAIRRYYIVRNRHYLYDLHKNSYYDYCKLELGRTKKEFIKIWLFEKNKIQKTKYMIKGYLDYKKGKKGSINEK